MKNNTKILILLSLFITFAFSLLGFSNQTTTLKTTHDRNTVVIGYDNSFVPMGFLDEDNNAVGFDIDLAKEVFSRVNMKVKFQNIDWAMKDTELNSGNVDALWNGYTLTDERKKKINYSTPYLTNKQVIVTLKNSAIHTKDDLNNKSLGTQQGSSGFEAIEKNTKLVENLKDKTPILYDSFDNAFRDLEYKRVDAVVADEVLARYYISHSKKNSFTILKNNFGKESFVVGFKKGNNQLRDKVNTILEEIKNDGTYNEIYNKWFN